MNEWKTSSPPSEMTEIVFVLCGNGEVTLTKASNLNEDNQGLCWIAWQK